MRFIRSQDFNRVEWQKLDADFYGMRRDHFYVTGKSSGWDSVKFDELKLPDQRAG